MKDIIWAYRWKQFERQILVYSAPGIYYSLIYYQKTPELSHFAAGTQRQM